MIMTDGRLHKGDYCSENPAELATEHLSGLFGICSGILFGISDRKSNYLHSGELTCLFSDYHQYLFLIGESARPCDSITSGLLEINSLVNQGVHEQLPRICPGNSTGPIKIIRYCSENPAGVAQHQLSICPELSNRNVYQSLFESRQRSE